jgi:hypothetical protein
MLAVAKPANTSMIRADVNVFMANLLGLFNPFALVCFIATDRSGRFALTLGEYRKADDGCRKSAGLLS